MSGPTEEAAPLRRLLLRGGALCLLAALVMPADAAPDPEAASTAVTQLRDVFQHISRAIDAFAAGNGDLVALGKRTAVTLLGVLLVWGLVKSWILGKGLGQLLPEFIQPMVIFGLAFWSVDHLGPAVKSSVEALGQVFSATLFQTGALPTESDILDRMAAASFEVIAASPERSGNWINVPSLVVHEALGFMFRLVAGVVLMVAGVIAAGVMMVAKVQTALAILFAPVMIPWAMWQPSAFLFNAWLGFLVGGAMQGVMSLAVASLSARVVDQLVVVARSLSGGDGMSFVTCCVLLLMAMFVAFLFLKVPSLANGLVGGATLNLEGWRATVQGIAQGASMPGRAVRAAGSATYQFGRGAAQGFMRTSGTGVATPPGAPMAGPPRAVQSGAPAGLPTALGRGAGALAGVSVRHARGAPSPSYPPAAPPASAGAPPASRAAHRPFRPKPGSRPVNRPVGRVS